MTALIDQLYQGVIRGEIQQPFTTDDFKQWMIDYHVTKDDGTPYADSSINALLSNSSTHNKHSTSLNRKVLNASTNVHGRQDYWFDPIDL